MKIKEDLLHFIWKTQAQKQGIFIGTSKEKIEISNPGFHNHYEGPDFREAIVKIDGQTWAGNIEIHTKSSDWLLHKHSEDKNYQNVILHVVYWNDKDIYLQDGTKLPVIELRHSIDKSQIETYQSLMNNALDIPCQNLIGKIEPIYLSMQLNQSAVQRLQKKAESWLTKLEEENGDWNSVFYQRLMSNFGFKSNSEPMKLLAQRIPLKIVQQYAHQPIQIYALLFGMAGMLNPKAKDDFEKDLFEEFQFLRSKHKLKSIQDLHWKMVKTRPANYPSLRIAQIAELFIKDRMLFSKCLETHSSKNLINIFKVRAAEYWASHHSFGGKRKKKIDPKIGEKSLHLILINTVAQALFSYGIYSKKQEYKERALDLLQMLPPEQNRVTKAFKSYGFILNSALESQGVLSLNRDFCKKNACLSCQIGQQLLKS